MNGHELIEQLRQLGWEALRNPVIIRGYEGGHNTVSEIEVVEIAVGHHKSESYYGEHQIVEDGVDKEWIDKETKFSPAIHLSGKNP